MSAFWPTKGIVLERIRFISNLNTILTLDEAWLTKTKTLSPEELLRVAFSITEHTTPHPKIETLPFRFRFSGIFGRKGVATDCVNIFRRLAASNVIAELVEKASKKPLHTKESIQALARAVRIHGLVKDLGDLPPELTPAPVHPDFGTLLRAILLYAVATKCKPDTANPVLLGKSIYTLIEIWKVAHGTTAYPALAKLLKDHSKAALAARYVEAVCKYQHIPITEDAGFPGVKVARKHVRDALLVGLSPRPDLEALGDVYGRKLLKDANAPIAKALATDTPPELVGPQLTAPIELAAFEAVVGPIYDF